MSTLKRLIGGSLFVFVLAGTALTQQLIETPREPVAPSPAAPLVTATATAQRVRFVSPVTVVQLRLEVYNEAGQKLFDTELRGGNVLDWHLQDGAGARVPAGSYASVLTIKSLSGRLSQRMGVVRVNEEKAAMESAAAAQLSTAQQQTIGPVEGNAAFTVQEGSEAITAVTHDGTDGQLTSTVGALTFRTGDVFAGTDKEHVRITPEGSVGIGTDKPQAKLDVAGAIRTSAGIEFANGTKLAATATGGLQQTLADGTVVPNATGTGTQNRVAKWTNNSGALGDSTITEVGGRVGIGVTNPSYKLVVGPDIGPGLTTSDLTVSRGAGQSVSAYVGTSANGMNFGWDNANLRAFVNAPVASPIAFTHGGVSERMRIAPDGRVGIGVPSPQAQLHVNGNVNFIGLRTQQHATSPNVIGGHSNNTVTDTVFGATISGGGEAAINHSNRVTDNFSTVGGGRGNQAGDNAGTVADRRYSTVGGGGGNTASGEGSTVSGGVGNTASNNYTNVGGGASNAASGSSSTVGGGENNIASGTASTIPGGFNNIAAGNFSFAAGEFAKAFNRGSFVWADSTGIEFTSTANNQFIVRAGGGVGINTNSTSAATLNVDGSGLFTGNLTINGTLNATLPAGSSNYIQNNPAAQQSGANFNISGVGTLGGLTVDINTLHVDAPNNRVGIGTNAPENTLHVAGTARASILRASVNAGSGTAVTVGEYYRDNALIAWGKVFSDGTVTSNETFGITVVRDSAGVYTITLLSTPTNQSVPVAVAEVDAAPNSAATARLVTIDQISLTQFKVYITNGSFAAVDNDFLVMVTGR